jgi:peroxiredoxin
MTVFISTAQITLTDPEGRQVDFRTAISGQYQVVVFMLADCPACQTYSKTLRELYQYYRKQHVQFTGVFPGTFQTKEEVASFRKSYRIEFPLLIDSDKLLTKRLGATVAPEVFVLDQNGSTVYSGRIDDWMYAIGKKRAVITKHDLRAALEAVVHEKKPDPSKTVPIGCIID